MSHILLTGASGFVGRNLSAELRANGHVVREAHRTPAPNEDSGTVRVTVGEITDRTDWGSALDGVDQVVHMAARVHVMRETSADPLAAFRLINVEGTERLARVAAAAGVKRFLFISSIGVNGQTTQGKAFTETDPVKLSTCCRFAALLDENLAKKRPPAASIVRPALRGRCVETARRATER